VKTTTIALLALGVLLPRAARAQRPAGPTASVFRPAPRVEPDPPISFRPFFFGEEEAFAAVETFKAVFGRSYEPFFGGGLQVVFHGRYYVEANASRFKKTGQRVFRNNGQNFSLGIPLTATITPVEIVGGYRFKPRQMPRVRPFLAAGVTVYSYKETSDFVDASDNIDTRHAGFAGTGGVEFRLGRWFGLSGDATYTHVTGILGQSGVSKEAGETDLGGLGARIKLIVGR
jgi:hypothetical protein